MKLIISISLLIKQTQLDIHPLTRKTMGETLRKNEKTLTIILLKNI